MHLAQRALIAGCFPLVAGSASGPVEQIQPEPGLRFGDATLYAVSPNSGFGDAVVHSPSKDWVSADCTMAAFAAGRGARSFQRIGQLGGVRYNKVERDGSRRVLDVEGPIRAFALGRGATVRDEDGRDITETVTYDVAAVSARCN